MKNQVQIVHKRAPRFFTGDEHENHGTKCQDLVGCANVPSDRKNDITLKNTKIGNRETEGKTDTICQRSSDPFYVVTYYIKWVTTAWTHCIQEDIESER